MRVVLLKDTGGVESLTLAERPEPAPGPHEVLVRIRAASLNYRDLVVLRGGYGSRQRTADLIPVSDAAGDVVAMGPGVTRFAVGDRVLTCFFQRWIAGEASEDKLDSDMGRKWDGVLAELKVFGEQGLVLMPPDLTPIEAAALPCAGLTAWSAIVTLGHVAPGEVVLTQGTGGVSLFAVQFAKLAGAEVIATSSRDGKLARLAELGADHLINYRTDDEWGQTARELTGGRGVDHVVDIGGAASLKQSLRAVRPGGTISVIGVVSGPSYDLLIPLIGSRNVRLQGVTVGAREGLEAMLKAMAQARLKPVVDKVFPLAEVRAAYEHLASGEHVGKVCIEM